MLKKWQIQALEGLEGWNEFVLHSTIENQKKLLIMAKNKEPRPSGTSFLGARLKTYLYYPRYANFKRKIHRLAPHWFIDTVLENKKLLLKMAKNGERKPIQITHPLGKALNRYVTQSSNCYDPELEREIRKLAPHWVY